MTISVAAGSWTAEGVWSIDEDNTSYKTNAALKQIKTYLLDGDGQVCAQVQPNGYVVKCSGPVPPGSEFVRYGEQAFKYWTVEDAQAFLEGEAVNPYLPKANLRKN
jgi:hypothetical protein